MPAKELYAAPRSVTNLDDCFFYHTMDIPGYGQVKGAWDLRGGEREYLGGVDLKGKRVLEIGTASGFLCFYMESQGAEVVAYDLSEEFAWDIIPYVAYDYQEFAQERRTLIRQLNNGYWLCHRAYQSNAKIVYGTVYAIPQEIGLVDIATFGSVLLHVRDPFLALYNALRLTRETVIITEPIWYPSWRRRIAERIVGPHMVFLPDAARSAPKETWWSFPPEIMQRMIGVLGFGNSTVKYHHQKLEGRQILNYTIIGQRTHKTGS